MNVSIGDLFKGKENNELRNRVAELEAMLTPEMRDTMMLKERITNQQNALIQIEGKLAESQNNYATLKAQYDRELLELSQKIAYDKQTLRNKAYSELESVNKELAQAKSNLIETNEEILMQSFGLYKPHFAFANSTEYKDALSDIRNKQKDCIKKGQAATGSTDWTVNGDKRKGAKMISDMQKLLIRAFNCECDDVIDHVKFNNVETAENRIDSSYNAISKLGAICGVAITPNYRNLKISELYLAHEYQIEKQKEKDALKQLRAEERERAKLEKEIAEARKKIEKEQKHYSNALSKLLQKMEGASKEELASLEEKKAEIVEQLTKLDNSMKQVDYREANQKAGYVYIISNVGAFGENVYKIGMTRRLEPMDRIDELGDASVPFDFDVHALIFSDNAPALEASLHRAFEDRKLNMINTRREFFKVTLEEIKAVVTQNFDQTVDFIDIPLAEQYRQSELLRKSR